MSGQPTTVTWLGIYQSAGGPYDGIFLFAVRIVPDGREGSVLYARSLALDEPDDGRGVSLRPELGEALRFKNGGLRIHVGHVDQYLSSRGPSFAGVPLVANTLWTWLSYTQSEQRMLLAAARRLDASAALLARTLELLRELRGSDKTGVTFRRAFFDATGVVELFVIAFHRVLEILAEGGKQISAAPPLPMELNAVRACLKDIRDSYEHIDERAQGLVRGQPHEDALSVFDFSRFVAEGVLSYASCELPVESRGAALLLDSRKHLLDLVAATTGEVRANRDTMRFFEADAGDPGVGSS